MNVRYQEAIYDWEPNVPGQDFNRSDTIDNNYNSLVMFDTATMQPRLFSVPADSVVSFHFVLDFNPSITTDPPNSNLRLRVEAKLNYVELGLPVAKTALVAPKEFIPLSGTISSFTPDQPVVVTGDLTLSNDMGLASPLVLVDSGAAIIIEQGSRVVSYLPRTVFEGCNTMWKGIVLRDSSVLQIQNTTIRDAQYAVSVWPSASLIARGCHFLDNNLSIVIGQKSLQNAPENGVPKSLTLLGNSLGTTGSGLKPAYSGQSPAPFGNGFAGMYLRNAGTIHLDVDPSTAAPNYFYNLKYGIITKNTTLQMGSGIFQDITRVASGAGYSEFSSGATGKAVYGEGGTISIVKSAGQQLSFLNCHTGVETLGATTYVENATMAEMTNGVIATNALLTEIRNNIIHASDRGVELRRSTPLGFSKTTVPPLAVGGISGNTIALAGNPKAVGINTAGNTMIGVSANGTLSGPPQFVNGMISDNTVSVEEGANAIQLNATRNVSVYNNTITLENAEGNSRGIGINAGELNRLSCNHVSGSSAGDHTGIYLIHASQPQVRCNLTAEIAAGIQLAGLAVGKSGADIAGNEMKENATGLLYGVDAISGPQLHRGNVWSGTGSVAEHQGDVVVANFSKYTVDALENPEFLPDSWTPFAWFEDIDDAAISYVCPNQPGFCINIDSLNNEEPDQNLDVITALGEWPGEYYEPTNNWLAQRRLYERIAEEGNPYLNNSDITGFLAASQSNGLAAYAEMQIALRQIFEIDPADQDSLVALETQLRIGLDSLRALEQQLFADEVTPQDSIALSGLRNNLLVSLTEAAGAKNELLGIIDTVRALAADSLLVTNTDLTDLETPYADNEKLVNDILLRTVAKGLFSFSTQDSITLASIAASCPLSDGEPVLWARALLAFVQEHPEVYDDEATCSALEQISALHAAAKTGRLRVYPNPAKDYLMVEFSKPDAEGATFLLFNSLGQLKKIVALPNDGEKVQCSLSDLPPGIYWYLVPALTTAPNSGKVIIHH
ncbi:MAG: T9SS type A sorting domain-containing protein [Saprospiraceae bacterium]|nr:T9SS type A sorting domain-containing protein [Saprospiraceae bacterium]